MYFYLSCLHAVNFFFQQVDYDSSYTFSVSISTIPSNILNNDKIRNLSLNMIFLMIWGLVSYYFSVIKHHFEAWMNNNQLYANERIVWQNEKQG